MRPVYAPRLVVSVLILVSVGCSSNEGRIEGTRWSSQSITAATRKYPAGHVRMDFAKNGTVLLRIGPKTISGKYSLGWGSLVTITLDEELDGKKVYVEKVVISGNQLTMIDLDGVQVSYDKVQ